MQNDMTKEKLERARESLEAAEDDIFDLGDWADEHEDTIKYALDAAIAASEVDVTDLMEEVSGHFPMWTAAEAVQYLAEKGLLRTADTGGGLPDGWKLVPVEPTLEIMEAGAEQDRKVVEEGASLSYGDLWTAMLAAAPTHPEVSKNG